MTPAPQGAGVFVSGDWEEVVEVTDDNTGAMCARILLSDSITLQMEWSVPKA
jgi:hypothetical protein